MASGEDLAQVRVKVDALGAEIRDLKAALKSSGLTSAKINQNEAVLNKVAELQELKKQLGSDDPAQDEVFFARQKAERDERSSKQKAELEAQQAELKAEEAKAPQPLVQRKIFHLFCHAGSGPSFRYEPPPRFNFKECGFGGDTPNPAVYITEKWDGTTMQATSTHIFKRIDLWGKRRDGQDPSQRYDLRLLAWRGEDTGGAWKGLDFLGADVRFAEALSPHLDSLSHLEDGLCVYFEAVHTDINANFKKLPGFAQIRLFDSSRAEPSTGGKFLPFEETIAIAERHGLPIVGWVKKEQIDAKAIWEEMEHAVATGRCYQGLASAPLEGFVVREAGSGSRIAKARLEQIQAKADVKGGKKQQVKGGRGNPNKADDNQAFVSAVKTYAELASLSHLQTIGIFSSVDENHPFTPLILERKKPKQ
eukprot:TRINITY_DN10973_c1_g1_i1.p1 TRINITY_DN10973_c1_g1~~TRINITY_DN10973_c1_g1_i1.p1  ORF type:complete len:432 (+),score=109.22 TRINITY_DN10973_c1_g1_i1:34-1296(+)